MNKLPVFRKYPLALLEKIAAIVPIPDKIYLHLKFYLRMGKCLNLKNPQTFNEKLQWLKLYGRRPIDTILSDKYAVKEYIAKTIGEQYVIPLIGVWDRFEDIDFSKLPNQFVLKCTHDSGGVVICKDKSSFDIEAARKVIDRGMKHNFYVYSREKAYKDIPRRVIAEEYREDSNAGELKDYKFFCFNGVVKFFKIDFGRFTDHHANYYSPEGKLLPFGELNFLPQPEHEIAMPNNLAEMVEIANKLSEGLPFIRVDFYNISGQILFGEFTFSPAGGMGPFEPDNWDVTLGNWIKLPIDK